MEGIKKIERMKETKDTTQKDGGGEKHQQFIIRYEAELRC
jgi:hypothetical protein